MANKKSMNAVEAGAIGAVVGAAVGAAAATLSSEKNRKAIGKKFNEVKKEGLKIYSDIKNKAEDMASGGKAKVKEVKKVLKK